MKYQAFVGATCESQATNADQESLTCMFVDVLESPGASAQRVLLPTPGVQSLGSAATSPGRAHFFLAGREFAVFGTKLVEIDASANQTVRGTMASNANPATISSNGDGGDQLFITSGGNGYCYNLTTNTLTQIAALNVKATMGDFLDSYFIALDANTSTLYISALLDGLTWNTGTDFAQRSAGPDPWKAVRVVGQFVWLLGEVTSEVWYDTGNASFPFGLHPSGRVPYGIAAPFSIGEADGALLWLGQTGNGQAFVLRSSGFSPEVVSPPWLQAILGEYATISDAVAEVINFQGHQFYLLTFPSEDRTWCYDATTGLWFSWETWIAENNAYSALRSRFHAVAFGEHRTLDSQTGSLYRLDPAVMTDVDSRPLRPQRRAPCLSADGQRIFLNWLELLVQPGVGAVTGQGSDPQVMLRLSYDGGKTWGIERWRSIGKIGEYGKRVRWERLGMGRYIVVEATFTDPVPFRVIGAEIELAQPVKGRQQQAVA